MDDAERTERRDRGYRRRITPGAIGRLVVVLALTAFSIQNSVSFASADLRTIWSVIAVVSGALLLLPRLPWFVAPAVVATANVVSGWVFVPLFALCLYDLAVQRRVAVAVAGAVPVFAVSAAIPFSEVADSPLYGAVILAPVVVATGWWMGFRKAKVDALREEIRRADRRRDVAEALARSAERDRIATEMHDVLAHRLSLIALHTGVLEARAPGLPSEVGDRLRLLRSASVDALTDLRDVLGVLHDHSAVDAHRPALIDVETVVAEARAAGQEVELTVDGTADGLHSAHRLAVQRVVQESLTNARKHSRGAAVTARVDFGGDETVVRVDNVLTAPARTASPDALVESGYGLIGLRERVESLGGTFAAGPADAVWRVESHVPRRGATP